MMRTFRRMARRLRRSEATFGKFESNFAPFAHWRMNIKLILVVETCQFCPSQ